MGWGAGLKLDEVLDNAARVIAVEILCAVQGLEYRRPLRPSAASAAAAEAVRAGVPPLDEDRPIGAEIELVADLIESGRLLEAVEQVTGPFR